MRRPRSNPLTSLFTKFAVALVLAVLTVLLADWTAGMALKAIREKRPTAAVETSDAMLRQLYDAEDVQRYREVLQDGWRLAEGVYSPFVEYRAAPSEGKGITVTPDGWRGNGRGPQDMAATGFKVLVFGGSTTLGVGVPDGETIPAFLEEALQAAGRPAQVFNLGGANYFSTQERILLERLLTAGVRPDVVVFVDGVGDFYNCAVPDRSAWFDRLTQLTRGRARQPLIAELTERSNLVNLARHLGGDKSVSVHETGSFCETQADIDRAVARLDANRRMLDGIAERMGFKVVFVQQPVPTFSYDNRKRPAPIREEAMGYHMNSARGYPRMAGLRGTGRLWEKNLLWLAELEPDEGNAYVDAVHYSPRFNKAIAARVAAHIVENGLLPAAVPAP